MKRLETVVDGKLKIFFAERVGTTLWIHVDGETFAVEKSSSARRASRSGAHGGAHHEPTGDVQAPMPGKITQVRVKTGDAVDVGQVLIVMEAMKMEYSLKSPIKGHVEKIVCQVGDQVTLDQGLMQIKK